jgi:hypothetical protein
MVAGLPGTGIGGIFYFLLAAYMPVSEFFRMLNKRAELKRWCFIGLQLAFVAGILAAIWAEVWALNECILRLGVNAGIQKGPLSAERAKLLAFASATGSLLSLSFVFLAVHILRLLVGTKRRAWQKLYRRWNSVWYKAHRSIRPKLAA